MEKIREYLGARTTDPKKVVEGKFLFTLYDTHGFPVDLAQEVFQDAGWSVPPESLAAFESEMEAQRERARAGGTFQAAGGEDGSVAIYQRLSPELPRPTLLGHRARPPGGPLPGRRGRGRFGGDLSAAVLGAAAADLPRLRRPHRARAGARDGGGDAPAARGEGRGGGGGDPGPHARVRGV